MIFEEIDVEIESESPTISPSITATTTPSSDPTISTTSTKSLLRVAPNCGMLQFADICTGPDGYGLWTLKLAAKAATMASAGKSSPAPTAPAIPPPRLSLSGGSVPHKRQAVILGSSPTGPGKFRFAEVCKLVIQELQTTPIKRYVKIWDDRNTGAKENDLAIFRPMPPASGSGFVTVRRGRTESLWRKGRWISLGDYAERSHLERPLTYNFESPRNARRFLVRECVLLHEKEFQPSSAHGSLLSAMKSSLDGLREFSSSNKLLDEQDMSTEFFVDDEDEEDMLTDEENWGADDEGDGPDSKKSKRRRRASYEEPEIELERHDFEMEIGKSANDPYNLMLDIFPPPLLAYPEDYRKVWDNSGTGGITSLKKYGDVSIWRPIPPLGYVALGHVASPDRNSKPSIACMGCVHMSTVMPASVYRYPSGAFGNQVQGTGYLWCDRHSGGRTDGSLWMADGEESISITPLTFISNQGYSPPSHDLFWAFPLSDCK